MEKDDELKGEGNSYDFGARIYDSRLGRWLARDPLAGKYPMDSPYMFAGNSPTIMIDPNGKEKIIIVGSEYRKWNLTFVLVGLKRMRQLDNPSEQTTMLLFTAGYTDKQLEKIRSFVAKQKNVELIEVSHSADITNYINDKSIDGIDGGRSKDLITRIDIYAHGVVKDGNSKISFGYSMGEDIERQTNFTVIDAGFIDEKSFSQKAEIHINACRTGASIDAPIAGGKEVRPEQSVLPP